MGYWDAAKQKWVPGDDAEACIAFLPANDAFGHIKDAMLRLEGLGWNERARLINQMKGLCQGVHIMAIGWEKRVPAVLEAAGLLARV